MLPELVCVILRRLSSKPPFSSSFYVLFQTFSCLSFSHDGKHLLGLGGGPDWTATLWNWEKQKVICTGRVGSTPESRIYEATICPWDPHRICAVGDGCLKFLRNNSADSPTHGVGTWQVISRNPLHFITYMCSLTL